MDAWIGTSGYSYPEWKGVFYPERWPSSKMLSHYASKLCSVELNNTFYRMPKSALVRGWAEQVPDTFRFALKAPRRITHIARLVACEDAVEYLLKVTEELGVRRGPYLFQLPPTQRRDDARLGNFLSLLPSHCAAAFEFRHPSWFDDGVFDLLQSHNAALVGGDVDESDKSPPFRVTADWGYLRLRKTEYAPGEIEHWAERMRGAGVKAWYAYFKHETQGPQLATDLSALCAAHLG